MGEILFIDKSLMPDKLAIAEELGITYKYWEEIKESLNANYGNIIEE